MRPTLRMTAAMAVSVSLAKLRANLTTSYVIEAATVKLDVAWSGEMFTGMMLLDRSSS